MASPNSAESLVISRLVFESRMQNVAFESWESLKAAVEEQKDDAAKGEEKRKEGKKEGPGAGTSPAIELINEINPPRVVEEQEDDADKGEETRKEERRTQWRQTYLKKEDPDASTSPVLEPVGINELDPPGPIPLFFSSLVFTLGLVLNLFMVARQVGRGQFQDAAVLSTSAFMPGIVQALQLYGTKLVQKSRESVAWDMALAALQVNRLADAYKYAVHGTAPVWMLLSMHKHSNLTCGSIFSLSVSALILLRDGFEFNVAALSLATTLVAAPLVSDLDHKLNGSPSNMEKYRIWDLAGSPVQTKICVFLIDWTQTSYRLVAFGLIYCLLGGRTLLMHLLVYGSVQAVLNSNSTIRLTNFWIGCYLALTTGVYEAVHDLGWLEPWAAHYYLRYFYPLRCVQLLVLSWSIFTAWGSHPEYDHILLSMLHIYFIANALLWVILTGWYVHIKRRDAWQEAGRTAEIFLASLSDSSTSSKSANSTKPAKVEPEVPMSEVLPTTSTLPTASTLILVSQTTANCLHST